MECIFNTMKYFEYYHKHTYNVVLAWKDIQDILFEHKIINEDEFNKINKLIIWHDNSKISKEEFSGYGAKFYLDPTISSEETLKSIDRAFKIAWEHHKKSNFHHHQSLKDYLGDDWKCYVIEMVCDFIAMGWETETLAYEYYKINKDKINLPTKYKLLLEEILHLVSISDCYANELLSEVKQAHLAFK